VQDEALYVSWCRRRRNRPSEKRRPLLCNQSGRESPPEEHRDTGNTDGRGSLRWGGRQRPASHPKGRYGRDIGEMSERVDVNQRCLLIDERTSGVLRGKLPGVQCTVRCDL
jgi:hypothetical protein